MTVLTSSRRVIGVGNGATTVWPYAFLIPLAAELSVTYTNPNRDAIDPTGTGVVLNPAVYSVTGIGNVNGGNVTYPLAGPAVAAPITITIVRTIPKTQPSTMQNQGGAYPATYETALDNVEMQVQEVAEIFLRTPSFPIGYDPAAAGVSLVLPTPQANAMLAWDATGKFLQNVLSVGAMAIVPIIAGQVVFGAAGNVFAQDANLSWDNTNKILTVPTINAVGAGLLQVSGTTRFKWDALKFSPNNDQINTLDLGATGFPFKTGYFGTSVVTPLLQNVAGALLAIKTTDANQLQIHTNNAAKWSFIGSTGGGLLEGDFVPIAGDNVLSFGGPSNRIKTGYFGTSVVTPLVGTDTAADLNFKVNGAIQWLISNSGGAALVPNGDNTINLGEPTGHRIAKVFTPIIDSGTTGSLLLKTNNGTTGLKIDDAASGINFVGVTPGPATLNVAIGASNQSGDTNVNISVYSKGTGIVGIYTNTGNTLQFQVLHTASANRNITVTGSNGGNPTIGVTAGSLAITPNVVIAGNLNVGNSNATPGSTEIVFGSNGAAILRVRNSANSGDVIPVQVATQVAADIVNVGAGSCNGVYVKARSGGAAPTTTDLPAGFSTVWRDTGGATTKLYYNNAGTIQSVALA